MADEGNITIRANGPYMIQGTVKLIDAEGKEYTLENDIYMLCRCGHSSNKPFCDGSHRSEGFQAESAAR
mgnify:CR=1 FL=1|jgi:CDGSH-type Zn-finger protein